MSVCVALAAVSCIAAALSRFDGPQPLTDCAEPIYVGAFGDIDGGRGKSVTDTGIFAYFCKRPSASEAARVFGIDISGLSASDANAFDNMLLDTGMAIHVAEDVITIGRMSGIMLAIPGIPIPVNEASADDLTVISGIGRKLAAAIVAERLANGPFKGPDDLVRVKGIGKKKSLKFGAGMSFQKPVPRLSFSIAAAASSRISAGSRLTGLESRTTKDPAESR